MKIKNSLLLTFFAWMILLSPLSFSSDASTQVIMQNALDHYLTIQEKLANDTTSGVEGEAQRIAKGVGEFFKRPCKMTEESCATVMEKILSAAQSMKGSEINALRKSFQELSEAMIDYWKNFNPPWPDVYAFHCSLADDNRGASWLQKGADLKNPYLGHSLSKCGIPLR
jgi:Cu(I)/Ag(I) efflux system membrane fusion protein